MEAIILEKTDFEKLNNSLFQVMFDLKRIKSGDEYLTKKDIAEFCKVSISSINRWIDKPRFSSNPFPLSHRGGEDKRWLKSEIIEWMRRNGELAEEEK